MAQLDRCCRKDSITKKTGRLRATELLTTGRDRTDILQYGPKLPNAGHPTAYASYVNVYVSRFMFQENINRGRTAPIPLSGSQPASELRIISPDVVDAHLINERE